MSELIAFIGVVCIMVGGWMISPGFGVMTIGIVMLFACAYFGAEGS